jgi:ferredoxin
MFFDCPSLANTSSNVLPDLFLLGHVAFGGDKLFPISKVHYFFHWLYGKYEPQILMLVDWILRRKLMTETAIGRSLLTLIATVSHYMPHGIVVPTQSAINIVRYIDGLKGGEDAPKLAVGPCVCQASLNRWKEPSCKDLVVLYGAEIYLHLNRGYRIIDADEAVSILEQCRDAGLVHSLDFCMQSGKWHFVICNCDKEICVLVRTFLLTGKMVYAGPLMVKQDREQCLGPDACGSCVNICMFGANSVKDGAIHVDSRKCYGCGQCVRVCKGNARSMVRRARYSKERVIPSDVLLKDML